MPQNVNLTATLLGLEKTNILSRSTLSVDFLSDKVIFWSPPHVSEPFYHLGAHKYVEHNNILTQPHIPIHTVGTIGEKLQSSDDSHVCFNL